MNLVPPLSQVCEDHRAQHTGEGVELEMMMPSPGARLDKRMAEVMVLATKMELTSIEFEVCSPASVRRSR